MRFFFYLSGLALTLQLAACSVPANRPACPLPGDDPIGSLLEESLADQQSTQPLDRLGHTIQVGAFANLDNAVRLERSLDGRGIDAYYFRHVSGLYKVRFGNYPDERQARNEAEQLRRQGLIAEYYVVAPQEYAVARLQGEREGDLRNELVQTARRFLGVPYRWGGSDRDDGFDCSGLTMVCYRLNGLNLPRVSGEQFRSGRRILRCDLKPGDLVFFATTGGGRVSHVGLYIGRDRFIHAPRTGQQVCIEALDNPYYAATFVGGRSYL